MQMPAHSTQQPAHTAPETPSVSVVIPTYNRERYIARAIDSVLPSLLPCDEIIIVDDGSTDGTAGILADYGERIRVVIGDHRGCGAARNRGVREARGDLVAFNDSDDEWMPHKLPLQRALMTARPDVLFCFSDFGGRHEGGREEHRILFGWHGDARPWDEILGPGAPYSSIARLPEGCADFRVHIGDMYRTMLRVNYVASQSTLIRRVAAGDALRFAEDVPIHEDWECFARLARIGKAAFMDCETFWQWGHDGVRISGTDDLRFADARIRVIERIWGQDAEFMAAHGGEVRRFVAGEHLRRARSLRRLGRTAEARDALRSAGEGSLSEWLLALLPVPIMRGMAKMRQTLRHTVSRIRGAGGTLPFAAPSGMTAVDAAAELLRAVEILA